MKLQTKLLISILGTVILGFGLAFLIIQHSSTALQMENLRNYMWFVSVSCIVALTFIITRFSLHISSELEKLSLQAKQITKNNWDEPLHFHSSSPEIAELSESMKEMVHRLQQTLLHSEAEHKKFAAVFTHMFDAIVITDEKWNVINENKNAKNILGLRTNENLFRQLTKLFQLSKSVAELHIAETETEPISFDMILPETKDSKEYIFEASLSAVKTSHHAVSYILTAHDVTEARCEELNKTNILSLISHKLLTPLSSLMMIASLFHDGLLGEMNAAQQEHSEKLLAQIRKMQNLIQHLIQFSFITSEHCPVSTEKVNMDILLEEFSQKQHEKEMKGKITFELHKDASLGEWLLNKQYLDMMLTELVENAVKFNKKEDLHIDLYVKKDANKLKIEVRDNGSGIPAKYQEDVFLRFFQIDKNFTGSIEGIGLGLPMVKNMANKLGGSLVLESHEGEGSVFTLELPGA